VSGVGSRENFTGDSNNAHADCENHSKFTENHELYGVSHISRKAADSAKKLAIVLS